MPVSTTKRNPTPWSGSSTNRDSTPWGGSSTSSSPQGRSYTPTPTGGRGSFTPTPTWGPSFNSPGVQNLTRQLRPPSAPPQLTPPPSRITTPSSSGADMRWARNIDSFGDASSAAEAIVNDTIRQLAPYLFDDQFNDPDPAWRRVEREIEEFNRETERNLDNARDALRRLQDDFQDAIDNIPAPQPDTYPSPSLDCKHWVQFTRSASVATYAIEPGQYGFYSIEAKSTGVANQTSYELVGDNWEVTDQYFIDFNQDWTSVSSGGFFGDTDRVEFYVSEVNVWESRSSGRLNPQSGVNFRLSNTNQAIYRINVVYPLASQYNVEGDDMEHTPGEVIQRINEFDPATCTAVEQDRRRPRPRERDDDMQCLAPMLIGRLDRIIALMEHNVLTEAQIDQIAASAKGLKAQTKTLKALKQNMAIPEFWELKPGLYPQAAIVFGNKLPNGKIGRERRTLHIPHYTGREGQKPSIPEYDRGPFMARIILKDNSKMYCYAKSEQEAIRVVNAMAAYTKQSLLPGVPPSTGKTGYAKSTWRAVPLYLQYYSDAKNGAPDWQVDFG